MGKRPVANATAGALNPSLKKPTPPERYWSEISPNAALSVRGRIPKKASACECTHADETDNAPRTEWIPAG
jgi:hypothetical protein